MKFAILSFFLTISVGAFGASQRALTITNNIDTDVGIITINDNNGRFTNIQSAVILADGSLVREESFDLNKLLAGAVVATKKNTPIVKIRFDRNFDPAYGGHFILDYLFSGVSGERRQFDLDLSRNGSKWEIIVEKKAVSKLHFIGNKKPVIGTIGVDRIQAY